jgi:membrane associated rhomboid family serine protease
MDEPSVTDASADDQVVRATTSPTLAGDWSLVLAAAGINHRVAEGGGVFALIVSGADAAAATDALAAYDAESVPKVVPPAPDVGPSVLGVLTGAALLAMFAVTGPGDAPHPTAWFAAGAADAAKILHGQWWRVITALTLHADVMHVVGNVIATLIFVSAVGRWLGAGLGALLIVASAALANGLTALWHRHEAFVSMGASTATFAAIGVVAGLQLYRRWRYDERRRYFWLPLGAGLALFAMLGTSQNADFGAHLFGLLMGTLAGTIAAATRVRAPGRLGQTLLSMLVSAVLIGGWMLAFRTSGRMPL